MKKDIKKIFLDTIYEYGLLKEGEKILVGCSGGQDSVTLLLLLHSIKDKFKLKLFVCHLNHGLRKEATKEEIFVSELSKKLNLPFFSKKVNVKDFYRSDSLEQTARFVRYNFFKELSQKLKVKKIALGHTKDDLIETVLMRILRGSGLMGLRAFKPLSEIEGMQIIRPLINIERKDTLSFLKNLNHPFCKDSSNLDTKFLRNKIRLKLIPFLIENFGACVKEHIFCLSKICWQDYEFIEEEAKKFFRKISSISEKEVKINLEKFQKLHISLQSHIFRLSYQSVKGDLKKLTFSHWEEVKNILCKKSNFKIVYLPEQIIAFKSSDKLIIKKVDLKK